MSTLLSRPLLIDQDDHVLEIPDGRLENINDPMVPHPLSSVALQATLGLHVSHLFQRMATDNSVQLVLEIEEALEKWMGTFPAALRDHRPDTRWDAKYPSVPFMRSQINVVAYCYLLAPLKPYLLGNADPVVMNSPLGRELRIKGVDTCLDLMQASEKFYDLIFPQSIKYFFIIFFMFDAATVMCSAIVHDVDRTLPKRNQCIRSLRTAQELMDGVAHLSESARISAQLLRKLAATLPLSSAEKQILGVPVSPATASKKIKTSASPDMLGSGVTVDQEYDFHASTTNTLTTINNSNNPGGVVGPASVPSARTENISSTVGSAPYDLQPQAQAFAGVQGFTTTMPMAPGTGPSAGASWGFVDYGLATTGVGAGYSSVSGVDGGAGGVGLVSQTMVPAQLGDPLTGTYLDPLWDWNRLNMDLSPYSMPQYGP